MMEAAQRQSQICESEWNREESESGHTVDDDDDEEAFDLNRIISGMATLSGPCGTYAVREREGVAVVSSDPRKKNHVEEATAEDRAPPSPARREREPFLLEYGQTVQIVDFEDGVAKLARSNGYIVATSSQLVKGTLQLHSCCSYVKSHRESRVTRNLFLTVLFIL
jgi:hypothetical protein